MNVAIAGYTGLTGSSLLVKLISDDSFKKIILVGRKSVEPNKKIVDKVIPIGKASGEASDKLDAGFCLLGTTIGIAGSKENFRKVDVDYVVDFAQFCKKNGATSFHLMSSVGANASSGNFYLKTKGEVEEKVKAIGFECLYIYRPSMLLGDRKKFRYDVNPKKNMRTVVRVINKQRSKRVAA